jgi:hypothetical protein
MIELKKVDIVNIAARRFAWRMRYKFAGFILGVLAVMVVVALITPATAPLWQKVVRYVPVFAALIYGVYRYARASDKAVKEFVKQCEADPELYYNDSLKRL